MKAFILMQVVNEDSFFDLAFFNLIWFNKALGKNDQRALIGFSFEKNKRAYLINFDLFYFNFEKIVYKKI